MNRVKAIKKNNITRGAGAAHTRVEHMTSFLTQFFSLLLLLWLFSLIRATITVNFFAKPYSCHDPGSLIAFWTVGPCLLIIVVMHVSQSLFGIVQFPCASQFNRLYFQYLDTYLVCSLWCTGCLGSVCVLNNPSHLPRSLSLLDFLFYFGIPCLACTVFSFASADLWKQNWKNTGTNTD